MRSDRKIIYYAACSLDSFIAGVNDDLDWLPPIGEEDYGYKEFLAGIDTVLMGRRTYDIVRELEGEYPYKGMQGYVFTRKPRVTEDEYVKFSADPVACVRELLAKDGKDIWLVGGGEIAGRLAYNGILHELIITIIPILLGNGISLFKEIEGRLKLTNLFTNHYPDGLVQIHYHIGEESAMTNSSNLQSDIDELVGELVQCREGCTGIENKPEEGLIPRCLLLEDGDSSGTGCAIIGLNPGKANKHEIAFYQQYRKDNKNDMKDAFNEYWKNIPVGKEHKYVKSLRKFIQDQLKLSGPILWTELAKCQNDAKTANITTYLDTLRTCSEKYLSREIRCLPKEWPLFGIGYEAYKAISYLFPTRTVIGIPHPTGSHGQFSTLLNNKDEIRKLKDFLEKSSGHTMWTKITVEKSV